MGESDDLDVELGQTEQDIRRWLASGFAENQVVADIEEARVVRRQVGANVTEILGYSAEELEADPALWLNVIHPSDRARVREAWGRLTAGEPMIEEYRIFRADGQMRWIRESCAPQRDVSGSVTRLVGMVKDVTGEKCMVERLAPFRQLVDEAPLGVSVRDASGRLIYCNKAYAAIHGYDSPEELAGTTFEDIVADEFLEEFEKTVWPRLLEGPWSGEVTTRRRDGTLIELGVSTNVVREADGTPVAIHAVVSDVTERKRGEQALRESEQKCRELAENVDAVIFRMDPQMRPIALTGALEKHTGYSVEEVMSHPEIWPQCIHADDAERVNAALGAIVASAKPGSLEMRIMSRTNEVCWLRVHVTPRFDESGRLAYLDGVAMEIPEIIAAREQEARYSARMASLAEISRVFGSSMGFNEMADAATQVVSEALDCLSAVLTIEPKTGRVIIVASHHRDPAFVEAVSNATLKVALTDQSAFGGEEGMLLDAVPHVSLVSPAMAEWARESGAGPGLVLPVYSTEDMVCIIANTRKEGEAVFDDDEVWYVSEVVSHASAALKAASLYERQSRIAETLQLCLIPASTPMHCLDVATCYFPAPGEAAVGGDFYDLILFSDCLIGIVVGDVSGKGTGAAVHTAEAKYLLRGYAHQNPDPSSMIAALNDALCRYTDEFAFVTLVYILFDAESHTMTYVNAGHEAPYVIRRDRRTVTELQAGSPALGITEGYCYEAHTLPLSTDELLFCYTDGLTDVPHGTDRFGHERLLEAISRAPVDSPQALLDYVVQAVRDFGRGRQPDDQVIVVARPTV